MRTQLQDIENFIKYLLSKTLAWGNINVDGRHALEIGGEVYGERKLLEKCKEWFQAMGETEPHKNNNKTVGSSSRRYLNKAYSRIRDYYLQRDPLHVVLPTPILNVDPQHAFVGQGVQAEQDYPKGALITQYSGRDTGKCGEQPATSPSYTYNQTARKFHLFRWTSGSIS